MKWKGSLNRQGIEEASGAAYSELKRAGIEEKQCLAFRLTLEEILNIYLDGSCEGSALFVRCRKLFGDLEVVIRVNCREINPLEHENIILGRLLKNFVIPPEYSAQKGSNRLRFVFTLYNTTFKNYVFTWKYVKQQKGLLLFSISAQLFSVIFGILAPIASAGIIRAYTNNKADMVLEIAGALLIISLLKNLFMVISNQGYNHVYTGALSALESDVVDGVLKITTGCIEEKGTGLFIQRITGDTSRIASGYNSIADMFVNILNYAGILIAMFSIDPSIALVTVVIVAVQVFVELFRTKRLFKDDRIFRSHNEQFTGLVGEMVRGHRDIRLLNNEKTFWEELTERINTANEKRLYMQKRSWNLKLFRWETGEFGTFAFIALLAYLIAKGEMIPATALIIYNYYSDISSSSLKTIGSFLDSITDFNISNERVCALLTSAEFPKEHFGNERLDKVRGEITFEHVDFSYDTSVKPGEGRKILQDMSFVINPGETVGLVGKSGCGKTTAFNLITKLYEPDAGKVLLDGKNIKDLTKDSIRGNITVVSQSPYIFRMSVRDNLKLVKPDLSDDEMIRVCRLACIDEDINLLPQGYDTMIGEGGVNLSGGQRQRLAIARSMLRDSSIVLFDEATSALDNDTQARIQQAIDNIRKDRTVIIIAHRLSTVINSDRIFFMQDGNILAKGRHEELLETCEPYRNLAMMDALEENG